MVDHQTKINIVGAGISGLTAAMLLEQRGYAPVIYEASDKVGGRLATKEVEGHQLDVGFQVLLEAYPKAQKHLDYDSLEFQKILPGAIVFKNGAIKTIGDPLRNPSTFLHTLFTPIGNWKDKWKILQLYRKLKKKSSKEIFEQEEIQTIDYLKKEGFSNNIIEQFFKPFFSGIFLEDQLHTSSRMFEFVFKMFAEGSAFIPKEGIEAIPKQILERLFRTKIHYNSPVSSVREDKLILENGEEVDSDYSIITTDPSLLIENLISDDVKWRSCENIYFKAKKRKFDAPIIGLIPGDTLINNLFYTTSVSQNKKVSGEVLSVTVVKNHSLNKEQLIANVIEELKELCGIQDLEFLDYIKIDKALPVISNMKYQMEPSETQLTSKIYLAGDQLLNPSLNSAFMSGERAAEGIMEKIEGRKF